MCLFVCTLHNFSYMFLWCKGTAHQCCKGSAVSCTICNRWKKPWTLSILIRKQIWRFYFSMALFSFEIAFKQAQFQLCTTIIGWEISRNGAPPPMCHFTTIRKVTPICMVLSGRHEKCVGPAEKCVGTTEKCVGTTEKVSFLMSFHVGLTFPLPSSLSWSGRCRDEKARKFGLDQIFALLGPMSGWHPEVVN